MIKKFLFFMSLFCVGAGAHAANDIYSATRVLERNADNTPCARAVFANALANTAKKMIKNQTLNPDDADATEINTFAHAAFYDATTLDAVLKCPELQSAPDDDPIIFETISYTFPNGRLIEINYETTKKLLKQKLSLAQKHKSDPNAINPDIALDVRDGNIWTNVDPAWYAILIAEHGTLDEFVGPNKNNILSVQYLTDNIKNLYPKNHGAACTSRTAIAGDGDMINIAATRTVGGAGPKHIPESDAEQEQSKLARSNDYYVLGDRDLRFISRLEIAGDVVLTIVTYGGYEIVRGALTAARGARAFSRAQNAIRTLRTSRNVARYTKTTQRASDITRAINTIDNIDDSFASVSKTYRATTQNVQSLTRKRDLLRARNADPKTIQSIEQELEIATKQATVAMRATETANKIKNSERSIQRISELEKTITNLEKEIKTIDNNIKTLNKNSQLYRNQQSQLAKMKNNLNGAKSQLKNAQKTAEQSKNELTKLKNTYANELNELKNTHASEIATLEKASDIQQYRDLIKSRQELAHSVYLLRQGKIAFRANRGLLPVRPYHAVRATRTGLKNAKTIDRAAKTVRANTGNLSSKINDWLFHNTLKNINAIARVPATLSLLHLGVKIAGDMYDVTDISSGEYTNNLELKPYLLLAADNLPGYENVVNYGMWLFWAGSSTTPADDDAAFLQAMSFAEKFHQDLTELQSDRGINACDIDIYVVRPIIRNPGTDNAELYYLFMNDVPWTTHDNEITSAQHSTTTQSAQQSQPQFVPQSGQSVSGNANGLRYTEPPYDGTKIGGACTKPSTSGGKFTNEILTTGRYKKYPAFEKAMITKFRTEGGCVDHPADSGGYTCYGVSSKYFPAVKNKNFSRADAEDIAYNSFFHKYHIDQLPDAISGDVFMALWGTGSKPASIGLLQKILGVPQTNTVDATTINAAKNYHGNLRKQFLDARESAFRAGQREFRDGWLNALDLYRANGCHTIAE